MLRDLLRPLTLPALALACLAAPAAGQAKPTATAGLNVAANIVAPPLNLNGTRDLQFGALIPGTPGTVLPNAANAGEARGVGADQVHTLTFTFTLPTVLTGPAGATIPLSFNGNYAATCEINNADVCDATSFQTWNPVTSPSHTDTPKNVGPGGTFLYTRYSVYIGGRASPAAAQRAGTYTGSITVTVTWN
ncbi:MAG: hypothetical protein JWM27_2440 [Gemmatimonadetes bacterium]|nr:hypothetical protein [Gemmatimonadota bacterium]